MGFERIAVTALIGVTLLTATAAAAGQQVVLLPNKDATLHEPTNANGSGPALFIGTVGAGGGFTERRGLISFNIAGSSIPAGATITSANLVLYLELIPAGAAASTINLHPLRVSWGEGPSFSTAGTGSASGIGDATWDDRFFGFFSWAAPGAQAVTDYRAAPSAFQTISASAVLVDVTWSTPLMAADVEFWLDNPELNFGWIMIGSSAALSAKRFSSREDLVFNQRPELTVSYVMPEPAPSLAGLTAVLSVAALRTRMRYRVHH